MTTTNKIFVANQAQRILVECELKGQLSDGQWENATPNNHWRAPCAAEVVVASSSQPLGVTWHTTKHYNFTSKDLLDIIGERMVWYVAFYTAFPDLASDLDDHHTFDLSDGWPKYKGEYWDKKRQQVLRMTMCASYEEIMARVRAVDYSMKDLKSDLTALKSIFTTTTKQVAVDVSELKPSVQITLEETAKQKMAATIIASFRGCPGEFDMLKGALCLPEQILAMYDTIAIAKRMDEINAGV